MTKLDATASEIVAYQRDSLVQRKELAQKTKDFRKLDDVGKLAEYKGLLKGERSQLRICRMLTPSSLSSFRGSAHEPREDLILRLSPAIFVTF